MMLCYDLGDGMGSRVGGRLKREGICILYIGVFGCAGSSLLLGLFL